jgi:pyruvate/2-oxoglutarate/acetoin dehydrogenase E1 component/TPP-dependent pyruvate/acetoin dehydrogenase alpha subunit
MNLLNPELNQKLSFNAFKNQVLEDYKIIVESRECALLGRREVLSGKGNFAIFGDGKELPQVVLNHFFKNGDFRAGYYRDQTILLAQKALSIKQIFSAIYADLDLEREPMSGGRQMVGHFVTKNVVDNKFIELVNQKNHSADVSPTASQMPKLIGLAQASKVYRNYTTKDSRKFSINGNEIAWGTIGNASTSEGMFFEAINAAGVLQIPMVISIWDDDYGISVHNKDQTTKESISKALKGFQKTDTDSGLEIIEVKGWDYSALINAYSYASKLARKNHTPIMVHVTELTQPLGHSSSGSHERYKTLKRLEWEKKYDCNSKMKEWILANGIANNDDLKLIEENAKKTVKNDKRIAWKEYQTPILKQREHFYHFYNDFIVKTNNDINLQLIKKELFSNSEPCYNNIISAARKTKYILSKFSNIKTKKFNSWLTSLELTLKNKISSKLYSYEIEFLNKFESVPIKYQKNPELVDGRIIIRDNFEVLLNKYDNLLIFGEDVGKIGDVNQGLEGLQKKFGKLRISDTGIREATIIGQGIGLALRGLRPIAEIQYLDYILYCIQILSDDLASLNYRTNAQQIAPLIIRTRGHRLEGIWHSGSPMGGMIHLLRGIHIMVPRNMTQAAGFYNFLMQVQQPAIVIEPLNGYRLKEKLPNNLGDFTIKPGEIEILNKGEDVTVLSYGSTLRIVQEVSVKLLNNGISLEVIDIQTLIPFDINKNIFKSITKTNNLLIVDEDVPGGASAYILQQLLKKQKIFKHLDSEPILISAKSHRPAYGSDGDYFSKPSFDDIFDAAYNIMHDQNPKKFPEI